MFMFDYDVIDSDISNYLPAVPVNQESIIENSKKSPEGKLSYQISLLITSDSAKKAIFKGHVYFVGGFNYRENVINNTLDSTLNEQFRK